MHLYQNHYFNVVQRDFILCSNVATSNMLPIPKKICLYLGTPGVNNSSVVSSICALKIITGQRPYVSPEKIKVKRHKKGKIYAVGCKVTLRGLQFYKFLFKLMFNVLPRIRQFEGLKLPSHHSVYCFVLKDIFAFEELIPLFPYFEVLNGFKCQVFFGTNTKEDMLFLGNGLQLCFVP
uniref:Ribosomal protein L5 n=2 Tax=Sargassum TaxID=3015 RepID=A0A344AL80_9PHAE|nr:ribosomal protein L5 [Sargassum yezoense]YP_009924820.1 ribosomal protein L7 [Sargassum siliquastrum]YP_010485660.1 ribosomal protein L7 [Sargassum macrocarpum]YP_010485697.1 ribosomal protein L7 [Sargassum serratifolium]AWV83128.1 ribosomal protein L5 [Sargassum yezoense]QNH69189.1 ribosomal protein L7 [Sargassum siliquastrum]UVW81769.1 ribosomal protein L7 [Sargassum macrocarpum]UVW81806.1 ribosomal protein L7 [Sargassum serratifolium]